MQLHFDKSGSGQPLVMMHGMFGSLENLGAVARILKQHFTVYGLDLRNHGRSPHADHMSFSDMADDLLSFLDAHNLNDVFLFGHSLGGKVAMEFACAHPARVRKLVVADIAPMTYPAHHNAILEGLASVDLEQVKLRKDADQQLSHYVDELPVRQFILKSLERSDDGSYRWRLNVSAIVNNYDDLRRAVCNGRDFEGPTLFLRGEKSKYIAERNRAEIMEKFPRGKIVTVKDAGHWLHAEQPQAVADSVIEFIN
ncbi:MAG: alpha/beta fold hydrolase [Cellvibrionaceae bacterium]